MTSSPGHVLVVDDELHTREICCDFLSESGYEIESASNGAEAFEILTHAKKPFDILLSDIQMPEMDGIALLKKSKSVQPQLEVILMTAYGALPSAIEAIRYGAYDYLTKPLSRESLLNTVRRSAEKIDLQRRLAESQAKLVEQEKLAALGSVSSWLSHKMRNSLSVIVMCAHYLSKKKPLLEEGDTREVVGAIVEKANVLEKITSDFINYAKAYRLELSQENLNAIMEEYLETLTAQLQIQKVGLVKDLDPKLPPVPCDAHNMREAFENIFVNALQAIGGQEGETITVATRFVPASSPQQPGRIAVRITNTGSFIQPDVLPRVFEPFFTTRENGSGLGMAIIKRIVEQHRGEVSVESAETGGKRSTTVSLWIPLQEPPGPA